MQQLTYAAVAPGKSQTRAADVGIIVDDGASRLLAQYARLDATSASFGAGRLRSSPDGAVAFQSAAIEWPAE
jgi:hypothetical protein